MQKSANFSSSEENYINWNQAAPELNREEAWPAGLFPDAQYHYFKDVGCLVTSLAIMLRHFGTEEENDENQFNPWILNNRLIEAGAFNRAADLRLWSINRIYPLDYLGQIPYSEEIMLNLCRMDYPFLITVTGVKDPRHFLAPYKLTGDDMIVIDPAAGKRCLSEFENICELRMFRPYKKSLLR